MKRFTCLALIIILMVSIIPVNVIAAPKYSLVVDVTNQVTIAYKGDTPYKYMICSTGASGASTPGGTYKMDTMRERFGEFAAYGDYAQFWVQIYGGIYFHSICYTKPVEQKQYIIEEQYNMLGNKASSGCIRLLPEDAYWVYKNCPPGTTVTVKASSLDPTLKEKCYYPTFESYTPKTYSSEKANVKSGQIAVTGAVIKTGVSSRERYITDLPYGTNIKVLQESASFVKVSWEGGFDYTPASNVIIGKKLPPPVYDDPNGAVNGTYALNANTSLYDYPANTGKKISAYNKGTVILRVGGNSYKNNGLTWYYVKILDTDISGYVPSKYLKKHTLTQEQKESAQQPTVKLNSTSLTVNGDNVTLYAKPLLTSSSVTTLVNGFTLRRLDTKIYTGSGVNWVYVEDSNTLFTGYVPVQYVL